MLGVERLNYSTTAIIQFLCFTFDLLSLGTLLSKISAHVPQSNHWRLTDMLWQCLSIPLQIF